MYYKSFLFKCSVKNVSIQSQLLRKMDVVATVKFTQRYRIFLKLFHSALSFLVSNIRFASIERGMIRFEGQFRYDNHISMTYKIILQKTITRFVMLYKAFQALGSENLCMVTKNRHYHYIVTVGACGFYATLLTHPDFIFAITARGFVGTTIYCAPWLTRIVRSVSFVPGNEFEINFYPYEEIVNSNAATDRILHIIPHRQSVILRHLLERPNRMETEEREERPAINPATPAPEVDTPELIIDEDAVVDVETVEMEEDNVAVDEPVPSTSRAVSPPPSSEPQRDPLDLSLPRRSEEM